MYGIDVPKSCQAALLYYNPVAERVVEAARAPGQLPPVSTGVMAAHLQRLLVPVAWQGGWLCCTVSPAQTQHSVSATWTGVHPGAALPSSEIIGTSSQC